MPPRVFNRNLLLHILRVFLMVGGVPPPLGSRDLNRVTPDSRDSPVPVRDGAVSAVKRPTRRLARHTLLVPFSGGASRGVRGNSAAVRSARVSCPLVVGGLSGRGGWVRCPLVVGGGRAQWAGKVLPGGGRTQWVGWVGELSGRGGWVGDVPSGVMGGGWA